MTGYCTIHEEQMTERESKTKFNADGTPKTYFAHTGPDGLCFGESTRKAQTSGRPYTPKPAAPARDFDAEARGKTRCQVFCSVVEHDGLAVALASLPSIEKGVEYVMNGMSQAGDKSVDVEEDLGF